MDRTKMSIQQLITPEKHDLGGFSVQRILPSETLKMVGPFIFFDHLGPAISRLEKASMLDPIHTSI
jgi:redox-sensitive bicupin YhaK (pirin superfamily)